MLIFYIIASFPPALYAMEAAGSDREYSIIAPLASKSLLLDAVSTGEVMFTVGERGHILKSTDGIHWVQQVVPTRVTLTAVFFLDSLKGWAVGHDATILRTIDGGEHWELVFESPDDEAPLLDIWFRNGQEGIAIGAYGLYLVSDDGGKNWQRSELKILDDTKEEITDDRTNDFIEDYDLHLNRIDSNQVGRLYIVAEAGRIFMSRDNGSTWHRLPSPYEGSLFGLLPLTEDSLLIFGLRGHLFRSDDGGYHWEAIETNTREMLTDAVMTNEGEIYICGLGGALVISRDQGKTFNTEYSKNRHSYTALLTDRNNSIMAVGDAGIIPVSEMNFK